MNSSSISESVRGYTDVLYTGLNTGKIPQEELPREFLGCAQKVRDSLWSLSFLRKKNLFQFGLDSVHCSVVFVVENLSGKRRHRLNMPRDDLVKVFKFLTSQNSSYSFVPLTFIDFTQECLDLRLEHKYSTKIILLIRKSRDGISNQEKCKLP